MAAPPETVCKGLSVPRGPSRPPALCRAQLPLGSPVCSLGVTVLWRSAPRPPPPAHRTSRSASRACHKMGPVCRAVPAPPATARPPSRARALGGGRGRSLSPGCFASLVLSPGSCSAGHHLQGSTSEARAGGHIWVPRAVQKRLPYPEPSCRKTKGSEPRYRAAREQKITCKPRESHKGLGVSGATPLGAPRPGGRGHLEAHTASEAHAEVHGVQSRAWVSGRFSFRDSGRRPGVARNRARSGARLQPQLGTRLGDGDRPTGVRFAQARPHAAPIPIR